ncbi:MAG: cytochrome c biosis protein CcmG, thiol:disulfide interchange protein DsbE [Thermoleophilaceae bacterium]|nr:cytochrome c biosis protein CcmG, thiol:disulfide interchange protein DsbE [Thermoleophilaceae bacterium]
MRRLLRPIPIVVTAAVVAMLALLVYGVASSSPDNGIDKQLASGKRVTAPALNLPELASQRHQSLSDYHGKVVVLNFWASWCVPCRDESPLLERWQRRMAARNGTVLGVDILDVTSDAKSFAREFKLTYPMLRDRDGHNLKAYGVVGYPESVVIDRRGRIAATRRGPVDEQFMRDAVLPLLKEPA